MSFIEYIKEKWYMFIIMAGCTAFVAAVITLEGSEYAWGASFAYVLSGIVLFTLIFIAADYLVLRARAKMLTEFIKNGGTDEFEAFYPADSMYHKQIVKLANEFNKFRAQIAGNSADEMDFITKWIHDVKVPISAMKLLLENDAEGLKDRLEMELSNIEQDTQKVLFHIKSRSFYDDYNISGSTTRSLINSSLKQFATFFAFKRIGLKILGGDYRVLTDSKWSAYILSQFISNAIKHTPEDGEITITTSKNASGITVSVKNSGQGIAGVDIGRVFDRGYTSSGREQPKATGYGLFLSKKLADKLGHTLRAESEYGSYAEFQITFHNLEEKLM